MLVILAILGAVRASPISREPPPIITVAQAASCVDPNGCRTLWNIIWSCLFTILLCTWVSVHPNIPGPGEEWPRITLRRVGIMVGALMAPELVVLWAMRQRVLAHELVKEHKAQGWTPTHGFFALMGGFMEYNGNEPVQTLLPEQLNGYSLTGNGDFPRIAIEDIRDKSKGDIVSKGLVVLQAGWFVTQCIARGVQGLPITELELFTIAFAVLNFAMYGLWWDKPLNVQRAVRVYKKLDKSDPSTDGLVTIKEGGFWPPLRRSLFALQSAASRQWRDDGWNSVWKVLLIWPILTLSRMASSPQDEVIVDEKRIGIFYPPFPGKRFPKSQKARIIIIVSLPFVAMVFGAIHCIAWAFPFPSDAERILWRVNSIFITGSPIAPFVIVWLSYYLILIGVLPRDAPMASLVITIGISVAYGISRVFLLVLTLLSLRALPPDAYRSVQWTALIPHF